MENKFWKGVLVGAMITAFTGLMIVGVSSGILMFAKRITNEQIAVGNETASVEQDGQAQEELDYEKINDKLEILQQYVDELYLYDENLEDMEAGIYMGFMYGLGDPYSTYYTEEDFKKLMEDTSGAYCGIGVMVSQDRSTGLTTVVKVFKDTPAHRAGMLPGDVLFQVGEVVVASEDLDIVINNHIKGEEGTPVTITVYRSDKEEYVEMTMNREMVEVTSVEYEMLEDKIGYIEVSQFDNVTDEQFVEALKQLSDQGMEKLIVDLRNNPGGVLDSVVNMLAYILPEGKIVYTADKNGNGFMYKSEDGYLLETTYPEDPSVKGKGIMEDKLQLDIPLVVLVNGNSASASEVFTGAVKDYGVGTVVGTTTYGKGIVQSLFGLGDGSALKLTISHYYTPSGYDIHKKGIEPDVVVELSEDAKGMVDVPKELDNQLTEAIKILK